MSITLIKLADPRPTRYPQLGYRQDFHDSWRFVDTETGASVGPQYKTKEEMFSDLDRYARENWGLT